MWLAKGYENYGMGYYRVIKRFLEDELMTYTGLEEINASACFEIATPAVHSRPFVLA